MTKLPPTIDRLVETMRQELDTTQVDVEASESQNRFMITVISPKFSGLSHLQQQDLVWAIVDKVCNREETMMVSLIMTFAPGEITEFLESL